MTARRPPFGSAVPAEILNLEAQTGGAPLGIISINSKGRELAQG